MMYMWSCTTLDPKGRLQKMCLVAFSSLKHIHWDSLQTHCIIDSSEGGECQNPSDHTCKYFTAVWWYVLFTNQFLLYHYRQVHIHITSFPFSMNTNRVLINENTLHVFKKAYNLWDIKSFRPKAFSGQFIYCLAKANLEPSKTKNY